MSLKDICKNLIFWIKIKVEYSEIVTMQSFHETSNICHVFKYFKKYT